MKKIVSLFLAFSVYTLFSHSSLGADEVKYKALPFDRHYLSDKKLDSLPLPEIILKQYDSLYHVFPQNQIESSYKLSHFYRYNSKFFRVQNDDSGRQWIHLSYDSNEKVIKSNYSKNYVRSQKISSIGSPFSYSFTFRLSSNSEKDGIQIFHIYAFTPINSSLCQLYYKNEILYFSIPYGRESGQILREEYPIGHYAFGEEAKFTIKCDGKNLSIFYNDKEMFNRPFSSSLANTKAPFFLASGLYPHKSARCFCEIFMTDIEYEGQ
ncbi:MAG: hypothetical protein K5873_00410 [Treponema sp.]|nr:hypothetical protein [Treponema sp.]